ncbi:MAG: nucleotidyl transferase AbiEii/AbiGii toxin family protein [Chloroflexi bacterium]|nr:nucleotidyl transferase AbiEii/AbiGii toxin family protein [Chloroflexota bacterium]
MRYLTAAGFRRALEDRLKQRAQATGESLAHLRKNVVFQRLLARLLQVSPDQWILKGALALDFRLSDRPGARPRATKDMDLARRGAVEDADADFRRVHDLDLGDYFVFVVQRTELAQDEKEAGGAGLRYRVRASVAGRLFEDVLVDVGFAPPSFQPESVVAPDLLDFAGLAPVQVPTLPTPLHVAEKVHAYTRRYGPSGSPSSRPKDLVDLVLLAMHEPFRADELRGALEATFNARGTHPLPEELPPPPAEWARPYAELARQVGIVPALDDGYRRAVAFLNPILRGAAAGAVHWILATQEWG